VSRKQTALLADTAGSYHLDVGKGGLLLLCDAQALLYALQPATGEASDEWIDLRREGDIWTLQAGRCAPVRLRHAKGLPYLQCLLERPGRGVHVLELAGICHRTGDAGPVLDARAKAAYRRRIEDLEDELAEAESFHDGARACRAREEMDALAEQLAGAVGLGGRDRRAASEVERARINVQRRIKDTIDRITAVSPAVGRFLAGAVRTGVFCTFSPRAQPGWTMTEGEAP
jgi:non-specific serine/threonine protein kinase